ncbi:predicted protein, partial [Postia placenta Mad-698-R]
MIAARGNIPIFHAWKARPTVAIIKHVLRSAGGEGDGVEDRWRVRKPLDHNALEDDENAELNGSWWVMPTNATHPQVQLAQLLARHGRALVRYTRPSLDYAPRFRLD